MGSDAQSLTYDFEVNYQRICNKCRTNQRCTLLAWKSIRELDKYLKNYPSKEIQSGNIQINNTMVFFLIIQRVMIENFS